jgi:DNA-binding Lrp family transcriptional regulator
VVFLGLAYVLIGVEIGAGEEVLRELQGMPEVKESYGVYGVYDIIVKVEANDMPSLKDVISSKIRRIDRVRNTVTMIISE